MHINFSPNNVGSCSTKVLLQVFLLRNHLRLHLPPRETRAEAQGQRHLPGTVLYCTTLYCTVLYDTFQCEDCNKMFKNEKNLRHHYKTHHERPHPKKDNRPKPAKTDQPKDEDDPNANSKPASASGSGGSR